MGGSLLFAAMLAVSLVGELGSRLSTEYFANVAIQQDHGVARDGAARHDAPAAPDASPILPVLASSPSAPVPAAADAVVSAPTPAPAALAAPADGHAGLAMPAEAWQPSSELLGLTGDTPARRPDGTVFLPAPLQRLMGLRAQITTVEEVTPSLVIPGKVVSSHNVAALVQAKQGGIVEPVTAELPAIGTHVTNGQLLATIRPVIDVVRRAEINGKIAELENLIQTGMQRILRLQEVSFIRYRESKINAVSVEIEGYRRQLLIFRSMLDDVTEIRAQTDGIISGVGFASGQIVEPQTTLFEIVDPKRLWIEATAFDMSVTDGLGEARAITGGGQILPLRFVGGGLSLRGQAVPLSFEVLGAPSGLQIGRTVTVVVTRMQGRVKGIRLPVTALVHNAGGETAVWQRLGAESFVKRTVTTMALDGTTVLVTAGLSPDMRIVTADTSLLSQVVK